MNTPFEDNYVHNLKANMNDIQPVILKLLANGKTYEEIEQSLGRDPRTVEHHIRSLLKLFEVDNRYQLVFKAIKLGMIELEDIE